MHHIWYPLGPHVHWECAPLKKNNSPFPYTHTHTHTNPDSFTITDLMHAVCQSNINAVCPCELGHVGRQSRVRRQHFDRQIPAERVHVDVLRPRPNGDLRLVLQNCGGLHRLTSGDELKVQAPPQGH